MKTKPIEWKKCQRHEIGTDALGNQWKVYLSADKWYTSGNYMAYGAGSFGGNVAYNSAKQAKVWCQARFELIILSALE